ncbi:MAG: DNA polymerase III subunit delta' [Campylobacteraceae bacterium]|nr:DNA polymerase III subunit delta' [Campylobacteraceae bacterium]
MKIEGSYIVVCRDLDKLKSYIFENYPSKNLKLFAPDDFLIDDAKAVIKEAYIAESEQKIIVTLSKSYNIYAQNSLLKILEEPPRNITFILCAPSKTIFLPTIRSRLYIKTIEAEKTGVKSGIDFKKMGIGDIYFFLKEHNFLSKEEIKSLLQNILNEAIEQNIRLTEEELEEFRKLIHLAELNSKGANLILCALLCIYERRYR